GSASSRIMEAEAPPGVRRGGSLVGRILPASRTQGAVHQAGRNAGMLVSRFLKEHDPGLAKGADMDWESVRDAFFEENGEKYVAAWWNGSGPGSGGRQSCSFLTDRTPPYGKPYALVSIWIDEAKTFDDKDSAEKFL